ncbi:hypothetical protein OAO87_04550 [bacterium]|nr:hypothetical protein [bacterium]
MQVAIEHVDLQLPLVEVIDVLAEKHRKHCLGDMLHEPSALRHAYAYACSAARRSVVRCVLWCDNEIVTRGTEDQAAPPHPASGIRRGP